jgi:hypothetical protein
MNDRGFVVQPSWLLFEMAGWKPAPQWFYLGEGEKPPMCSISKLFLDSPGAIC